METNEHRIYGRNVEVRGGAVKEFWAERAARSGGSGTRGTLLGTHNGVDKSVEQNARDNEVFRDCTTGKKPLDIVEFGCGNGRWGELLADILDSYTGLDFTEEYIEQAKARFAGDDRFRFMVGALADLPMEALKAGGPYTTGICAGCVMYLNDAEARRFYESVAALQIETLFLKESATTMGKRLTLVDFPSKELQMDYNVVYRTPEEYERFYRECLPGWRVTRKGWLYPAERGIWAETNSHYWYLTKE